jgi:hypothetical protein
MKIKKYPQCHYNFFVHISPNNFARQRLFKIREGHAISLDSYFRSNRNKYYPIRLGLCPVSNRNQRFFFNSSRSQSQKQLGLLFRLQQKYEYIYPHRTHCSYTSPDSYKKSSTSSFLRQCVNCEGQLPTRFRKRSNNSEFSSGISGFIHKSSMADQIQEAFRKRSNNSEFSSSISRFIHKSSMADQIQEAFS